VVGIGASAGGLEALELFVAAIEPNSNMAYVVVTHQAPGRPTLLPELLQRRSRVEVVVAAAGMKLSPNRLYVAPPGCCLEITDERRCEMVENTADRVLPIDHLFRSLARSDGEGAIGVVLSGSGSDGSLGIAEIKDAAGLVLAQDPETAKYPGMPRSAIATEAVDYVLAPERMPEQLLRSTDARHVSAPGLLGAEDPRGGEWVNKVLALLRQRTRHDFAFYKRSTVNRRIERRLMVHGFTSIQDYAQFVEKNPYELDALFNELIIGVTSFFRDAEAFEALESELEHVIRARTDETPIRVWVPGCSNGAEAYSIAILLKETLQRTGHNFAIQIFATDIDAKAIDVARTGRYPESISASISPERLERFFTKVEGGFRISKEVRALLVFAVQDVIKDPPFTKLDLLSCRNLLIYFDTELQRRVLGLFSYSINPGGLLFLGSSENLGTLEERFVHLDRKAKLFRVHEGGHRPFADLRPGPSGVVAGSVSPVESSSAPPRSRPGIAPLVERALLASHVPPSAIINDQGELIYLHGRTGPFLEPAPGEPSNNVFQMAREGLRLELPAAVRRAAQQNTPVVRSGLRVKTNGGYGATRLTVTRLTEPEMLRDCFVLTFELEQEPGPHGPPGPHDAKPRPRGARKNTGDREELELELQRTKDNLQGTIEEFETSNEELKSTNEELQSTNEELQSANEELETSREEMQSLNEELQTVNAEFEERNRRLSQVNDDMQNLLNSTEIATVFLDGELLVKRFTPPAKKVFGLMGSDVGRPLAHFAVNLRFDGLIQDAEEVLRTLVFREREIQTKQGDWRLMRILPYRTDENIIDGLVMTFVDIDRVKRAEEAAQVARAYAEAIVEAAPGALLVLDEALLVVSANKAFHELFHTRSTSLHGQPFDQIAAGSWQRPDFLDQLRRVLELGEVVSSLDLGPNFPRAGISGLRLSARRMKVDATHAALVLITVTGPSPEEK
jgi:two-component system CheB/CheR fusion protein